MLDERIILNKPETKALMEKWSHFLDAEKARPLGNEWDRYVMARMLDNTQTELKMQEDSGTSVFGSNYVDTVLGMIRQIFPALIAQQLVTIQPMDRPTSKVFFLDILRQDENGATTDPETTSQWASNRTWASFGEAATVNRQMTMSITSANVSTETRKLMTTYSMELQQDLTAYHGLDAGGVLQQAAIDEIAREIDQMIIQTILSNVGAGTVTYGRTAPSGYTYEEWQKKLIRAMINADTLIYNNRYRASNWVIAGVDACADLMELNSFVAEGTVDSPSVGVGVQRIGSVNNRWNVFRVPYIDADTMVLGYKGNSFTDAGCVFLPYVPLFQGERTWSNTTFQYTKGFASRFGLYVVSNKCFSKVTLADNNSGLN